MNKREPCDFGSFLSHFSNLKDLLLSLAIDHARNSNSPVNNITPELCVSRHLPNVLSLSRIPGSLLLLVIHDPSSTGWLWLSITTVLFIMASDFLDGRLARAYEVESKLGYVLDGLGDRAFHVAACLVLLLQGIIDMMLTWTLILREISQYAVRLAEVDWYSAQSRSDRLITQSFTIIIQFTLLIELVRELTAPSTGSTEYTLIVNVVLWLAAIASFSRIVPRLLKVWQKASTE